MCRTIKYIKQFEQHGNLATMGSYGHIQYTLPTRACNDANFVAMIFVINTGEDESIHLFVMKLFNLLKRIVCASTGTMIMMMDLWKG
jgi:hypothetical protein